MDFSKGKGEQGKREGTPEETEVVGCSKGWLVHLRECESDEIKKGR